MGGLQTATLLHLFHDSFARAGSILAAVYALGIVLVWFGPETRKGAELPD
jgi:hypothetical protein